MNFKGTFSILALLLLALNFSGCSSGNKYADDSSSCDEICRASDVGIAKNFVLKLEDIDDSDYDFELVKERANDPYAQNKRWIVVQKDLYTKEYYQDWVSGYYDYNGYWVDGYYATYSRSVLTSREYISYNIDNYKYAMPWNQFLATRDPYGIVGNLHAVGGNLYQDVRSGFTFEETEGTMKDLEKVAALKESYKEENLANKLTEEFGLSTERSQSIAKLALHWNKLSKKRAMTDKDANMLFQNIFGFSATDGRKALNRYMQGERGNMDDLIQKAALKNETTPEHINKIVSQIIIGK